MLNIILTGLPAVATVGKFDCLVNPVKKGKKIGVKPNFNT